MENEECAQRDAYFQEELESLKTSVAHLTSLLEQTLGNTSGEGPFNRPSVTPAPTLIVIKVSVNEPHKAKSSDSIDQAKIEALEAKLKVIEGVDLYDLVRAAEICLVPNIIVPKKFRLKWGNIDLVHEIGQHKNPELERLMDAFVKQYKYNMNIAPDKTSLSNLEKKDKESIRECAKKWRESAAQVHPPLLDKEMVSLFANTLKAPYYEHVMGSLAQQFTHVVAVCECIEQGVKSGRISTSTEKREVSRVVEREKRGVKSGRIFASTEKRGFERKEVHHVEDGYKGRKNSSQNYHTPSHITNIKKVPQNFQVKSQIGNYQKVQEQLPPLSLPLNEMYQKLLSIGQIVSEPLNTCAATLS
ncbi:hypothetical protein D5086_027095 [Populus alba]|uniref:Uncharacterized protein n=1 Tax=Populus alba TaxID=43335 RepID=A0ACC4B4D1_POPAL